MPNSYNAPNVICPFYHYDRGNQIVCESVTDQALSNATNFPSASDVRSWIESYCGCGCYQGCPLYRAIMEKYQE